MRHQQLEAFCCHEKINNSHAKVGDVHGYPHNELPGPAASLAANSRKRSADTMTGVALWPHLQQHDPAATKQNSHINHDKGQDYHQHDATVESRLLQGIRQRYCEQDTSQYEETRFNNSQATGRRTAGSLLLNITGIGRGVQQRGSLVDLDSSASCILAPLHSYSNAF